jgi:hypothetical protein
MDDLLVKSALLRRSERCVKVFGFVSDPNWLSTSSALLVYTWGQQVLYVPVTATFLSNPRLTIS